MGKNKNKGKNMEPILLSLSYWLHSLATVVFIGYFVVLAAVVLPVLSKPENGPALSQVSKRSRWWMYAALLVFLVTGAYLTLVDPQYMGLGNFKSIWAVLMLLKHLLLLVMAGMAGWNHAVLRVGPQMSANSGVEAAIARYRKYVNTMAICGALVLLLTAIAQVK
jgi:uncharacterized membrane protein